GPSGSNLFLSAGFDGIGRISHLGNGQETARVVHNESVITGAISPNGQWAVTASHDGSLYIWQPQAGPELKYFTTNLALWAGKAGRLGLTMDKQFLVVVMSDPETYNRSLEKIRIPTSANEEVQMQTYITVGQDTFFHNEVISDTIAFIDKGVATIYDLTVDSPIVEIVPEEANQVHLSPDIQRMVTNQSSGNANYSIQLWGLPFGMAISAIDHPAAQNILFSPFGTYLLTSNSQELVIWNSANGTKAMKLEGGENGIGDAKFVPDGERVAIHRHDSVEIWHIPSEKLETSIEIDQSRFFEFSFSPSGDLIVFNPFEDNLTIRRTDSMDQVLMEIQYHRQAWDISFSPDERWLAISRGDQVARVWDIALNQLVAEVTHPGLISGVQFNHNGTQLITTSVEDHSMRIWALTPEEQIDEACNRLPRNLTLGEWQTHIGEEPYRCTCAELPPHPSVIESSFPIAEGTCLPMS
ncbi:MAG: WD40 repeat domain-containing protein, partial [Chloroflexota bacterium]